MGHGNMSARICDRVHCDCQGACATGDQDIQVWSHLGLRWVHIAHSHIRWQVVGTGRLGYNIRVWCGVSSEHTTIDGSAVILKFVWVLLLDLPGVSDHIAVLVQPITR